MGRLIKKELKEDSVIRKFRNTASDGKVYETQFYNLDVIISVGYRVNSEKATKFRIWTTIGDGYIHEPKKITKKEAISFIASEWREDLKKRIKRLKETFPQGWVDKDTYKVLTKED